MQVVFDTNILIDQLRGVKRANELIVKVENNEITGHISTLTEAELFSGKDSEKEIGKQKILKLIGLFSETPVNSEIAQEAGEFRRKYSVALIDCIIASTALYNKCKLWTKNIEEFRKIKEIEVEEPY
jgi:hypothetical protein